MINLFNQKIHIIIFIKQLKYHKYIIYFFYTVIYIIVKSGGCKLVYACENS